MIGRQHTFRIRRQLCIALLGVPASLLARAQTSEKKVRVGVALSAGTAANGWPELRTSLAQRGWKEGRNLELVVRSAEGRPEAVSGVIDDLLRLRVDLIVANENAVSLEAKRKAGTIPIVVYQVWVPVEAGLVASIKHPGGNLTGSLGGNGFESTAKLLSLLKEAAPSVSFVPYLSDNAGLALDRLDPAGLNSELIPNTFVAAAHKLGIGVTRWAVDTRELLERAFAKLDRRRVNGLYVDTSKHLQRIVEMAGRYRLPACYADGQTAVPLGGLMGYNSIGDAETVAIFVDKILRGASPADLPMEEPKEYELWLNLKAAKSIGLAIPVSLQIQAARLFE